MFRGVIKMTKLYKSFTETSVNLAKSRTEIFRFSGVVHAALPNETLFMFGT